jgi:hypothetical protein
MKVFQLIVADVDALTGNLFVARNQRKYAVWQMCIA